MRVRYRHPPQGTHHIITDRAPTERIDLAEVAVRALPNDHDIWDLVRAVEGKDDEEIARLIPLLKARYGDRWGVYGRLVLAAAGRSGKGRRV